MSEKKVDPMEGLSLLKKNESNYPQAPSSDILEAFPNQFSERDYWIHFDCPEFTSLCPVTSQPDFGHISIKYIADKRCIESKSLKMYLFSYRNHNAFHESVTNMIMDDIIKTCDPREIVVEGKFRPRGGISINVTCSHKKEQ